MELRNKCILCLVREMITQKLRTDLLDYTDRYVLLEISNGILLDSLQCIGDICIGDIALAHHSIYFAISLIIKPPLLTTL